MSLLVFFDIKKDQYSPYIYLSFIVICLAFIPPLAFLISIFLLFIYGFSGSCRKDLLLVFIFGASASTVISGVGQANFLTFSDDYITYYNNYLTLLNGDYSIGLTRFSKGFEPGVPIVHLLFSFIINEPSPYIVKAFHMVFQISLFSLCIIKIANFYKLKVNEIFIFAGLMLLFYKSVTIFFLLRQGYASIFIVLSLFSIGKTQKKIYWLIAILFHVSSLIILPFISFVLFNKRSRNVWLASIGMFVFSGVVFIYINYLTGFNSGIPLLNKFNHIIQLVNAEQTLLIAIKKNLTAIIFLVPLILLWVLGGVMRIKVNRIQPVLLFFVFIISTIYIPGFMLRVLMPIHALLTGYLYFTLFQFYNNLKYSVIVYSIFTLVVCGNWVITSTSYYERYPMFSVFPFYYIDSLFVEIPYKLERKWEKI
ncbi:EpsG family protein [Aliivibrio sifiae]